MSYDRFLFSLYQLFGKVQRPYMDRWEVDFFRDLLCFVSPKRVLEWGAGYSTYYFSRYLGRDGLWDSVEHDQQWYNNLKNITGFSKVNLHFIAPNVEPWSGGPDQDGSYEDFKDYVEFPKERYDVIVVDGRARLDCIKKGLACLNPKGVLFLHDANRDYYHKYTNLFKYQFLVNSEKEDAGGVWVGSQDPYVLDFKKQAYTRLRKHFALSARDSDQTHIKIR